MKAVASAEAGSATRGSQAVDRALSVLGLFNEQTESLSVGEVADAIGVHRSTGARLLAALERHGLIERDEQSGRYRLGIALVSLAGHVLDRFPARASGRQILGELRDRLGETVYLGVLDGSSVVYIDQASSPHVKQNVDWVGYRQTLTEGVTGAMLLAFQPPGVVSELVPGDGGLGPTARPTQRELVDVRSRGYLARFPDPVSGLVVIAAPVRQHRTDVVAAITLVAPAYRVDERRFTEELVPATLDAAARVSESLGYTLGAVGR